MLYKGRWKRKVSPGYFIFILYIEMINKKISSSLKGGIFGRSKAEKAKKQEKKLRKDLEKNILKQQKPDKEGDFYDQEEPDSEDLNNYDTGSLPASILPKSRGLCSDHHFFSDTSANKCGHDECCVLNNCYLKTELMKKHPGTSQCSDFKDSMFLSENDKLIQENYNLFNNAISMMENLTSSKRDKTSELNKLLDHVQQNSEESKNINYHKNLLGKIRVIVKEQGEKIETLEKTRQKLLSLKGNSNTKDLKKSLSVLNSEIETVQEERDANKDLLKKKEDIILQQKKLLQQYKKKSGQDTGKNIRQKAQLEDILRMLSVLNTKFTKEGELLQSSLEIAQTTPNSVLGGNKTKKRSLKIFNNYDRMKLEKIAKKWGIKKCDRYKNTNDLKTCLKLLLIYKRGGYIQKRKHLNIIAKNINIDPKQYKTKESLKNKIDSMTKNVNMVYKNSSPKKLWKWHGHY